MTITEEKFYTPAEAAKILSVSTSYLRDLSRRELVPCSYTPSGKHRRYSEEDIATAKEYLARLAAGEKVAEKAVSEDPVALAEKTVDEEPIAFSPKQIVLALIVAAAAVALAIACVAYQRDTIASYLAQLPYSEQNIKGAVDANAKMQDLPHSRAGFQGMISSSLIAQAKLFGSFFGIGIIILIISEISRRLMHRHLARSVGVVTSLAVIVMSVLTCVSAARSMDISNSLLPSRHTVKSLYITPEILQEKSEKTGSSQSATFSVGDKIKINDIGSACLQGEECDVSYTLTQKDIVIMMLNKGLYKVPAQGSQRSACKPTYNNDDVRIGSVCRNRAGNAITFKTL